MKMFEVKETDKHMENGVLNAIYSRLALKNIWLSIDLINI